MHVQIEASRDYSRLAGWAGVPKMPIPFSIFCIDSRPGAKRVISRGAAADVLRANMAGSKGLKTVFMIYI